MSEKKIIELINQVLKNNDKPINEFIHNDLDLRSDLGFDSLDLAELTALIELEFDIDIFQNGIISNVQDILNKVNNKA